MNFIKKFILDRRLDLEVRRQRNRPDIQRLEQGTEGGGRVVCITLQYDPNYSAYCVNLDTGTRYYLPR